MHFSSCMLVITLIDILNFYVHLLLYYKTLCSHSTEFVYVRVCCSKVQLSEFWWNKKLFQPYKIDLKK